MFDRPLAFVSEPGNFDWATVQLWRDAGFGGFAVLQQNGPDRIHVPEGVEFRDRARQQGFRAAQWVNLETPDARDLTRCGEVAYDVAPHWDGTVVDAETLTPPDACTPFLAAFPHPGPLALSTVPTFECGAGVAAWDSRRAWLMPQSYFIENGVSALAACRWLERPPLYFGWYYRATVGGRSLRVRLERPEGAFAVASSLAGDVYVHTVSRSIRWRPSRRVAGQLHGPWNMARWAPTLRTTPNGDRTLDPLEAAADVRAAGKPPAGCYLAETTPVEFLRGYRP